MQMSAGNHKLIFEFLREKFREQESFTKKDMLAAIPGLKSRTMDTYWSKWIRRFLIVKKGKFQVAEAFRPYSTWERFQPICTQNRRTYQDYTEYTYVNVIIYDFLMPLSNEGHLRTTLDALFYKKDTVLARLRAIGHEDVRNNLQCDLKSPGEILEHASQLVAERFRGYSINHVNGRFRAADLSTLDDAAKLQTEGGHYLIDETTAVVRFIFHCGKPRTRVVGGSGYDLFEDESEEDTDMKDYRSINWLFRVLFVENILQVVNGEDEIWMVESGVRNRLHRWVVK